MSSDPASRLLINLAANVVNPSQTNLQAWQSSSVLFFEILFLVLFIYFSGFLTSAEVAIITLNDNKIKKMAEEGHKASRKILKLTENSNKFLATVQMFSIIATLLTSTITATTFSSIATYYLASFFTIDTGVLKMIITVVITLVLSYIVLVFGYLVPKKIAIQQAESIAFKSISFVNFLVTIATPFIAISSISANVIVKVFGLDPNKDEEEVTEEEILMMVDVGEEKGVIEESTKDMIANIFDFDDTIASEIMTHRTEVHAIEDSKTIDDVIAIAINTGYSRIPIYHEDIDDILGIVYVKDLLKYVGQNLPNEIKLTNVMRTVHFIPEAKKCSELFTEMSEKKVQMAVVCDEYGGTAGIITMEDLLEAIVGNIQDEYDNEEQDITVLSDHSYTVDGSTPIDEIIDTIEVDLPEGDYDTIAGFLVEQLGRIPKEDEKPVVTYKNVTFTVTAIEDRRLSKIFIEVEKQYDPDEQKEIEE